MNLLKTIHIKTLILIGFLIIIQSCKINYSLTGAPITAKSISIDFFPNKATLIKPSLSQDLTDALRDKFVNQTSLELQEQDAELHLEGEIVYYRTNSVAIQGDETAALNRLTIKVKVRYTNTKNEDDSFEQLFTGFEEYDANLSFGSVEDQLIEIINKRLVQDIFNKALVNW